METYYLSVFELFRIFLFFSPHLTFQYCIVQVQVCLTRLYQQVYKTYISVIYIIVAYTFQYLLHIEKCISFDVTLYIQFQKDIKEYLEYIKEVYRTGEWEKVMKINVTMASFVCYTYYFNTKLPYTNVKNI